LQRLVDSILEKHPADKSFVQKFRAAEQAWARYRDAELAARFPAQDPNVEYGSMFPMCWSLEHARMSRERMRTLGPWLSNDTQDSCRGSY
jgi:uncharacterized protein YecT (DUF1311 family)